MIDEAMIRHLSLLLAFCCFGLIGCQPPLDFAQPDHAWKECKLDRGAIRFRYPAGLRRETRSINAPLGFILADPRNRFSILVVTDARETDPEYAAEMLDGSIDPQHRLGPPTPVEVGPAKGLSLEHRTWETYSYRRGRTLVLTSRNRLLVLDVNYVETFEEQLQPVFDKVLASLEFTDVVETANSQTHVLASLRAAD